MNYGMEKFIRRDKSNPKTNLALRLTPMQNKQDLTTLQYRTYHLPMTALKMRASIGTGKGIMEEDNVEPLSYLPGDFVYTWKNPTYWKSLEGVDEQQRFVEEAQDCEDEDGGDNQIYVFSTFNLLQMSQFWDSDNEKWIIRNSQDLEDAIDVPCLLVNLKEILFNKDDLLNVEEKRKVVKGTDGGFVKGINLAHEGIKLSEEEVVNGQLILSQLVAGEQQELFYNDELEWYVPYFNNEITEQGLINRVGNDFKMNDEWMKAYKECLPKDYREDKRFTILYRRYDPSKETKLEEEYKEKILLLFHIFSGLSNELTRKNVINYFKPGIRNILNNVLYDAFLQFYLIFKPKNFNLEEGVAIIEKFYKEFYQTHENEKNIKRFIEFKSNIVDMWTELGKFNVQGQIPSPDELALFKTYLKKQIGVFKGRESIEKNIDEMVMGRGNSLIKNLFRRSNPGIQNKYTFSSISAYEAVVKHLLCEKKLKLHKLKRKIFARVMNGGNYKEHFHYYLYFKEPK